MNYKNIIFGRRLRFTLVVLVSQVLLITLAIAWGIHLILIAQNGGVYSIEANPWVLYGEIAATVLIILFAIAVVCLEFIRMKTRRQSDRDSQDLSQNDRRSEDMDKIESIEDLIKS
jgi:membrane protein implicated in regulation of membrane protease activity